MKSKPLFYLSFIFILILFTFETENAEHIFATAPNQMIKENDHQAIEQMTHEQIVELTDQFMKILVQDVDKQYRVLRYDSKAELRNAFDELVMGKGLTIVRDYINYYYEEKSDELYIIPTETPPWFNKNNTYDVIQLDRDQLKIVQENQSDLYGQYTIEMEFTFHQTWKITDINHFD